MVFFPWHDTDEFKLSRKYWMILIHKGRMILTILSVFILIYSSEVLYCYIFCICLCCWNYRDLFQSTGLLGIATTLFCFVLAFYLSDCTKWLQAVSSRHVEWREWILLSYGMKRMEIACWTSSWLHLRVQTFALPLVGKFHENMYSLVLFIPLFSSISNTWVFL